MPKKATKIDDCTKAEKAAAKSLAAAQGRFDEALNCLRAEEGKYDSVRSRLKVAQKEFDRDPSKRQAFLSLKTELAAVHEDLHRAKRCTAPCRQAMADAQRCHDEARLATISAHLDNQDEAFSSVRGLLMSSAKALADAYMEYRAVSSRTARLVAEHRELSVRLKTSLRTPNVKPFHVLINQARERVGELLVDEGYPLEVRAHVRQQVC